MTGERSLAKRLRELAEEADREIRADTEIAVANGYYRGQGDAYRKAAYMVEEEALRGIFIED